MSGSIYYRIFVTESESGWGQETWTEDFTTIELAKKRISDINSDNISDTAPDWYMKADQRIEVVEVVDDG